MNNFPLIFCSKISHITGTKNTYIVHDALFWQLLSHLSLVECQYGTLRRESREFLYNVKIDVYKQCICCLTRLQFIFSSTNSVQKWKIYFTYNLKSQKKQDYVLYKGILRSRKTMIEIKFEFALSFSLDYYNLTKFALRLP